MSAWFGRVWEGAFCLFRERHKLGPYSLKLCQLVIQLMHSRCCILIAVPDGWWIGDSPPIQNKPLGTKKSKRGPGRKKKCTREVVWRNSAQMLMCRCIFQMFLFLISMQQAHLFCCLDESQQKWRNTCVSSLLAPREYDFHSTRFQLPFFVATDTLFHLPLGHAWTSKHRVSFRKETKHKQCRELHAEKGRGEGVGGLGAPTLAVQVHWGCSGQMGSGTAETGGSAPRTWVKS